MYYFLFFSVISSVLGFLLSLSVLKSVNCLTFNILIIIDYINLIKVIQFSIIL